ncbi:hypothetical protein V6S67_03775 [Arthrobacter sp. Soc17.1.1.1]|uniref:hypothetical protein n=1 Tax=Arthrobacter sp. Soc17.1.1.1 TaxID=3121277 RepID=UPI002FE431A2
MKAIVRVLSVLLSAVLVTGSAKPAVEDFPATVNGGAWPAGHVQGIAVDAANEVVYYSFTTMLVKTDLEGTVLGTVTGFTGHLGDLDFNEKDGRVYGSLEYKEAESFYIAIFDVDRITGMDMDAETDGIVTAVHLDEVVQDFTADMDGDGVFDGTIADTPDHRYGSSGIDGVTFGPAFGWKNGKQLLTVAYGIYSNTERTDNDHQVLLQYDVTRWRKYEQPLTQEAPHTSGPATPDGKYFVRTGNTTYGVQNLDYDAFTHTWLLGVYKGVKPQFPNYSLFAIDGSSRPVRGAIEGQPAYEEGLLLPLLEQGLHHEPTGIRGWNFTADVGLESLGNGYFYIATQGRAVEDGVTRQTAVLDLFRWTGAPSSPFELVAR